MLEQNSIEQLKDAITPILKRAGVLRSSLFGSMARGEANRDSDVDLLVDLPYGKTLFDLIDLKMNLENALGRSVDLSTYKSVKPRLKEYIDRDLVLLYEI